MTTSASQTGTSTSDRATEVGGTAEERTGRTAGTAEEQAAGVAGTAKEQAAGVAGTAKEQALDVAHDAADQARNLLDELRGSIRGQMGTQRTNLAQTLGGYAQELRRMTESPDRDGPATEAVRQVASRLGDLKTYLEGDADVADDVRRFARRRPGAFLLACAAAGVLAGRATRGAAAARRRQSESGRHVTDVREPQHDVAQHGTPAVYGAGTGTYAMRTGPTRDPGTSGGAGTAAGDPFGGVEHTSDPNLRATSGPLADRADGYHSATGEPVPPDAGPGPTGVDEGITRAADGRGTGER